MNAQEPTKKASAPRVMTFKNVTWWIVLITAVIVVPSIAYTLTTVVHISGGSEVIIFIVSCWVCVYLGIKLMKMPNINSIMFQNVTISESLRQMCLNKIVMIEKEIVLWKTNYAKCEPLFMNLSKQPAWNYLDELVQIFGTIREPLEKESSVSLDHIKLLNDWIESSKQNVVEGYLHSVEATYGYAKAEYAQQGKNIDELFPELGKGQIGYFVKAPFRATTYARKLLDALEKENPMIGRASVVKLPFEKAA